MSVYEDLELLRFELDRVDEQIADLVGKRAGLARRIARVKAAGGIPPRDEERDDRAAHRFVARAVSAGYPPGEAYHVPCELIRVCRGIVEREASLDAVGRET